MLPRSLLLEFNSEKIRFMAVRARSDLEIPAVCGSRASLADVLRAPELSDELKTGDERAIRDEKRSRILSAAD